MNKFEEIAKINEHHARLLAKAFVSSRGPIELTACLIYEKERSNHAINLKEYLNKMFIDEEGWQIHFIELEEAAHKYLSEKEESPMGMIVYKNDGEIIIFNPRDKAHYKELISEYFTEDDRNIDEYEEVELYEPVHAVAIRTRLTIE